MRLSAFCFASVFACTASAGVDFDVGADLRVRQEMVKNVPGLPNGGVLMPKRRGPFTNHMRFRPRVWGELRGAAADGAKWRLYARLADEFRWCPEPYKNTQTIPGEAIVDQLFVEGTGLFDGFLDLRVGRQSSYHCFGLDHLFVDGTPGDGSRTAYTDMATFRMHFAEDSTLDLFALYNFDDCDVRWGTDRSKHASLTGFGGGADPDMDDWGFGAVWGSRLAEWLPYQVFAMQKNTMEYRRGGEMHPWTQRDLLGAKLVPRIDDEWSLQLEAMGQVGVNGDGDTLVGSSAYAGVNWRSAVQSSVRPFGSLGYHFMSGDKGAADEDGGHSAWDPMWGRGANDSEMFLYGTHYGAAWWSNQHYLKLSGGLELGRAHSLSANSGPIFAAARDGMGGGDGAFKGLLSQVFYKFPIWLADRENGGRFEVVGHFLAEFFNPGDYYETRRPAFFLRWEVEFRF